MLHCVIHNEKKDVTKSDLGPLFGMDCGVPLYQLGSTALRTTLPCVP